MGRCFRLVKIGTKEYFDLDKGSWEEAFQYGHQFTLHDIETAKLTAVIKGKVYEGNDFEGQVDVYAKALSVRLKKWAGISTVAMYCDYRCTKEADAAHEDDMQETGNRFMTDAEMKELVEEDR